MEEKWTKISSPSATRMKPKPFEELNHFTSPWRRPSGPAEAESLSRAGGPEGRGAAGRAERPLEPCPRLARSAVLETLLRLEKQSLQNTGRPAVGVNGISVVAPHCEHTAACIWRGSREREGSRRPRAPEETLLLRASRHLRQRVGAFVRPCSL